MYIWDPDEYERSSSEQYRWAVELLTKLTWRGNERVLDIGCGDGKVTAEIAKRVPRGNVLGIDNSHEMVRRAREKFSNADVPNLSFQLVDARDLPFVSRFDLIFSNATLHWIKDHRPVLQGIFTSLKPEGRTVLQMGGKGNAADVIAVIDGLIADKRWRPYFEDFTFPYGFHDAADYRGWLEDAGFETVRVEMIPKDMIHQGWSGFAGWVRSTWLPYTQRIPGKLREAFIAELIQVYESRFPADEQGRVYVRMMRLEVEAVKAE